MEKGMSLSGGFLLALLLLVGGANAIDLTSCEIRDVSMEMDTQIYELPIFHCYTTEDLYVKSTLNSSIPPILFTSTASQVQTVLAGKMLGVLPSESVKALANFAGLPP